MLNDEKVRVMNRLALYEQQEGKKYLPISKYYRSDYVGKALIRNLFIITAGYLLLLALVAVYNADFLMNNIHKIDIRQLAVYLIAGYAIVLAAYSVLTFLLYTVKYYRAKKSVRKFYSQLTQLDKMYQREERRAQTQNRQGGRMV